MAKGKSAEWLTEDGLLILKGLARDGCSDKQIYERIGISKQTFYDWCNRYPDFSDTIKKGREPVKVKVEDAFYSRCEQKRLLGLIFKSRNLINETLKFSVSYLYSITKL